MIAQELEVSLHMAFMEARQKRHEFITVEHLLLGLYDEEGRLNYVGRVRVYEDAGEIGRLLEPLVGGSGFTGRAPGGKSRWSGKERRPVVARQSG